jgi:hypothetical protein
MTETIIDKLVNEVAMVTFFDSNWEDETVPEIKFFRDDVRARFKKVLNSDKDNLYAENDRLRDALHDAICRPMGTCPDSAVEFIEEPRMAAALARRGDQGVIEEAPRICVWEFVNATGSITTACGITGPNNIYRSNFKFCPFCKKKIQVNR